MRIAYILNSFPVVSETFILREILELQKTGFDVYVFAEFRGKEPSNIIHDDAIKLLDKVYFFSSERKNVSKAQLLGCHVRSFILHPIRYAGALKLGLHSKKMFRTFVWSVYFKKVLSDKNIEHIHAHFALSACSYAIVISRLAGIPYSFTIHAYDIFVKGLAEILLDKIRYAKFVATISEYNRRFLLKQFQEINGENIKIVHCGIDPNLINIKPSGKSSVFTITSTGRLIEKKGFKFLVEACHILREKVGTTFTCNIIGDGKDRQALEDIIQKYNLSQIVHLLGAKEQREVMTALQQTDIFVLPCVADSSGNRDGIPVALMEAMAMGIPVISTKVSGIPELIGQGGGILVEPRNAESLADAMENLIALPEKERIQIGLIGRKVIEKDFNLEIEANKLGTLFKA